jgi:pentatricopeptide repeat protein
MQFGLHQINAVTIVLLTHVLDGQIQLAREFLLEMVVVGLDPDLKSYSATINACSKRGNVALAFELMTEMKVAGLQPIEII